MIKVSSGPPSMVAQTFYNVQLFQVLLLDNAHKVWDGLKWKILQIKW